MIFYDGTYVFFLLLDSEGTSVVRMERVNCGEAPALLHVSISMLIGQLKGNALWQLIV